MTQLGSQGLGTATGKIVIDTKDLSRIQSATQQVGQTVARNLGQIDGAAKKTQQTMGGLASSLGGLGGAFGLATGVGLAAQLGRMVVQADAMATAYKRQSVAALSLAGSQGKLNELLATYQEVTGGAIDSATALGDVTRLQAVGFADTAEELEKFTIAARGISVAMGAQQDYVIGQLQLAIANQSLMRLDQIGLGVEEVQAKIKELRKANSSLTEAQAYQNAILGIATQKYGALAKSTVAQATGAEKAAKAWKELQLQIGQDAGGAVGGVMQGLADEIGGISAYFRDLARDIQKAKDALKDEGWTMPAWLKDFMTADPLGDFARNPAAAGIRGQIRGNQNILSHLQEGRNQPGVDLERQDGLIKQVNDELFRLRGELLLATTAVSGFGAKTNYSALPGGMMPFASKPSAAAVGPRFSTEQTAAIQQWATDVQAIEEQAGQARTDAARQYGQAIVREEQDFARNRAKSIRDHARQIADMQEDIAKREADAARTYAEAVADVSKDAARREAKWLEDYNERVAELRADGNERLVELEEDYAKNRERAARDHRDRLMDAAARLDAVAVRDEQRAYARQQEDAKENYDDQREKIKEALAEQLADALKAQQERIADAREADAERLADMQEAQQKQLETARQADAERLADMEEDFALRLAEEDEERAIANQRRAEDHAAQMAQIAEQEAREKEEREKEFLRQLEELGIHNEKWKMLQQRRQNESLALFDEWLKEIQKKLADQLPISGPLPERNLDVFNTSTPAGRSAAGGSVSNRSITVAEGAINVYAAPGQSEDAIGRAVRREVVKLLEEAGG